MANWIEQHPKLASLLSQAGSVVGGAMWIKNFTPVGFTTYLLTNYGYDQLMALAEGNIEQGKANLAQFCVKHDKEITQQQAEYLANFTMKILTDVGGRIVFHKVAAKGFNKLQRGKKGGKVDTTGAKLSTNAVNLELNLASQAQMLEEGETIIENLRSGPSLALTYGGKSSDWVKKASSLFTSTKSGKAIETHWYENIITGQRVEFKTKIIKP